MVEGLGVGIWSGGGIFLNGKKFIWRSLGIYGGVTLSNDEDKWTWFLDQFGVFYVKYLHATLDKNSFWILLSMRPDEEDWDKIR